VHATAEQHQQGLLPNALGVVGDWELKFEIEVYDGSDRVAAIRHHRAMVAVARIEARLAERTDRARREAQPAKSRNDERHAQREAL
jgi:hypothetical protein